MLNMKINTHYNAYETKPFLKKFTSLNELVNERYKDKYLWHKAFYLDETYPMKVCCKSHGFFKVTPKELRSKRFKGCPKCGKKKQICTWTRADFHGELERLHPYITYASKFKGFIKPMFLECKYHGSFVVKNPKTLLNGKLACHKCIGKHNQRTTSDFIDQASKLHDNRYSYDKTVYEGSRRPITVTCSKHGDFTIKRAFDHYRYGEGCPSCFKGRLDTSLPATLYYLSSGKIGTTNGSLKRVLSTEEWKTTKLIKTEYFLNGQDCLDKEIQLKGKQCISSV